MSRWRITPTGLEFDAAGTAFYNISSFMDFRCQNDLCLTSSGYLADGHTLQVVTQIAARGDNGLALMDLANNRMFLLSQVGIVESYDATTYKITDRYVIPRFGGGFLFEKVAGDQLAILGGGELIVLPVSMLQPQ